MHADQLTDPASRGCAGVRGGLNRSNITAYKYGHIAGSDVFLADKLYVCGLYHSIGRLDRANETFGFDHTECF
jgi:hypothetical protein